MAKMITLFGKDIKELSFNELKREKSCQSYFLTRVRLLLKSERGKLAQVPHSQVRQDKVEFYEMYIAHLEATLDEIEYWLDRRAEPESNKNHHRSVGAIRKENEARRRRFVADSRKKTYAMHQAEGDSFAPLWDREKFQLIASDRGYQTEEMLLSEVGRELRLDRARTRIALERGRFTWGQVLTLGAMMQMTPKEFCDTFLAGYFKEEHGDFRADLTEQEKAEIMRRAVKSDPLFGIKEEVIEIGSDGRPLDEEEWF